MSSIIVSGLLTLVGTSLGSWLTYRHQRAIAQDERSERKSAEDRTWERERIEGRQTRTDEQLKAWNQLRRQAAVSFLTEVAEHAEACRAYWDLIAAEGTETDVELARVSYVETWRTVFANFATFQLSSSESLSQRGQELYGILIKYSEAVDVVAKKKRGATTVAIEAQQAFYTSRDAFITAAQADLDPIKIGS
jgi:hypothetical protein